MQDFFKGADVSLLEELEQHGARYYLDNQQEDLFAALHIDSLLCFLRKKTFSEESIFVRNHSWTKVDFTMNGDSQKEKNHVPNVG